MSRQNNSESNTIEALSVRLLEAVASDNRILVAELIDQGADVNFQERGSAATYFAGREFRTPLFEAITPDMASLLLSRGADPCVKREIRDDVGLSDFKFVPTGEYESFLTMRHAPEMAAFVRSLKSDKVRERAYLKWQAAGCPAGEGERFWSEAEKELESEWAGNSRTREPDSQAGR